MSEIRKQSRVNCDIIFNKVERGMMTICRATNISLGGMRVERLLEPFDVKEEKVRLEIELPGDSEPLLIGARRMYDEEGHFGLKFTEISHRHFVRLRDWVSSEAAPVELPAFH
jgi:hypothetical protein